MKCPLNVDVRAKKTLSIGFVVLLLLIMAVGVSATPWDGTPDDITPSQAIWVDPKNTTVLDMGDIFTVDVLVNITDPPGAATGLWGWQYVLEWNSTILEVVEVQTHGDKVPSGDLLPGHTNVMVADNTTTASNHTYVVVPMGGVAFTGVDSLCTYKFKVMWQPTEPAPDFCGLLHFIRTGIKTVKLTDDAAGVLIQGTPPIGTIVDGMYCLRAKEKPVASFTWSPETPEAGELVTFNGSLSTSNGGSIVSYAWNFSDGTPIANETDPITTHAYTATGTYNVTLTVADSEGLTNSTTKSITVQDNTPPTIGDPSRTPSGDVQPLQDVKVSVDVTDAGTGVKNVTLSYTITNGTTWEDPLTMTLNATSGLYEATIPGQSAWIWVKFNVTAYDNAENSATRDGTAVHFVYQVIPEFPPIIMLLLFMITALVAVILGKTVQSRKRRKPFVAK